MSTTYKSNVTFEVAGGPKLPAPLAFDESVDAYDHHLSIELKRNEKRTVELQPANKVEQIRFLLIWRQAPDASAIQTYSGDNRLRLYLNTNRLVGAVIMGDQKISYTIQQIIRQQVDIGGLRPRLLEPQAPLAELIQSFWQRDRRAYAAKIA